MPGPDLPLNVDATYADTDPENAGVKPHQIHHDELHGLANKFDVDAVADEGDVWAFDEGSDLYVPSPAAQGTQGDPGSQGDPGADGQDGLSAYELAVLEGFTGTLTEWLESLGAFPGESPFRFLQEGEIGVADSDDFFIFPFEADIEALYLTAITPATVTAIVVDYLKTEPAQSEESLWAVPGDRPELVADEQYSGVFTPDTTLVPAGTMLKVSVVSAGTPSEGGAFAVRSVSDDPVSSGSGTLTSWAIPLPATFAEGDMLAHVFATGAGTVTDLPDDWVDAVTGSTTPTPVQDTASSLHVYVIVKIALDPVDESLAQTITLSGGAVVNGRTLAFRSPEAIVNFVDDTDSDFEDTATASVTAPALTTSFVSEIGLWVAAARFTAGAGNTITVDGDLTELHNLCTTRTGTNTNLALAICTMALPTATTYGAYVFGTSPNTRWVVRDFALVGGEAVEETPGSDLSAWTIWRKHIT